MPVKLLFETRGKMIRRNTKFAGPGSAARETCRFCISVGFVAVSSFSAYAQTASDAEVGQPLETQRQLDIQRREAQQREQERSAPAVHSFADKQTTARLPVEGEQPCTQADKMQLNGPSASQFQWLTPIFDGFAGHCLGSQSLNALQDNFNDALQISGYVTSKIQLAAPAIQEQTVHLDLIAGRIGQFRLIDPTQKIEGRQSQQPPDITEWPHTSTLHMAMPSKPGSLLNVRDLDHAAESVQRLGYAMEQYIVPREPAQPGEDVVHDVVIAWLALPHIWQGNLSLDNSSSPAFGRTRAVAQMSLNNWLGLADQTYLSIGGNAEAVGPQKRQLSQSLHFTLPWGYHRFSLSYSSSHSALGIHGNTVTFTNSRHDIDAQLEWAYTLYRDAHYKITPEINVGWRKGSSHIEDVELVVQRRHATTRGLGVNITWVGQGQQIQSTLSVAQTTRQHRASDDFYFGDEPTVSTTRRWSGQFQRLFAWRQQAATYTLQWDIQGTRHPTPLSPEISLGGRYTVRGFSGDRTLNANDGMWVRNEWQWQAQSWWGLSPYVGLDAGKVWGATAADLPKRKRWLSGIALGLRGQWGITQYRYNVDFALATPIHGRHIEGQNRPRWVPYLSVSLAF